MPCLVHVIFDNSGSTTVQVVTDDERIVFAHTYNDQTSAARDAYAAATADSSSGEVESWAGSETEAAELDPDDLANYRCLWSLDAHDLYAESFGEQTFSLPSGAVRTVAEEDWGNVRDFWRALGELQGRKLAND